jgi:hypothetical protein
MPKSIKKLEKLATKLKPKSPRYSLIESKSRHGTYYGFCERDGNVVIISSDRNDALDFIYRLRRNEAKAHDPLIADVVNEIDPDEIAADEVLTDESEAE